MTDEESKLALKAVQTAWRREPMEDMEARQLRRLFLDHQTETVRAVIDDLIGQGSTRPGPAEFASMLRAKLGRPAPGGRIQRPGPYLDQSDPNLTPPESVSELVAQLRECVR